MNARYLPKALRKVVVTYYSHVWSSLTGGITETNRIHLVLFGMQNSTFGPYFAAIHKIWDRAQRGCGWECSNTKQQLLGAYSGRILSWMMFG
jgi:hypothetical protein